MVHVHNLFIRALNSLILQSPNVTSPTDITDLLFYSKILIITINAHHDSEEKHFFADLAAYTNNPKPMAVNEAQHYIFYSAIEKFGQYCTTTTSNTYSHETYKSLLDAFAAPLYKHLCDEIPTMLALKNIPNKDLKVIWDKCEKHARDVGSYDEMFPLIFGSIDSGFEGGKFKFPPVPAFVPYVVKYYFAKRHAGAWRFNPSDMWGRPRELMFLPKKGEAK